MQFPIVREYKVDILNTNIENEIKGEPKELPISEFNRVYVPRHAPFFVESLKLVRANGQPLDEGKDYRIFRLMPKLTELTGKPVACLIEMLNPDITLFYQDYDTVGESPLIDNGLLQLITAAVNDDRPVWWENLQGKPSVFPPTLHTHSILYDIMAFDDIVELLNFFLGDAATGRKGYIETRVDHYVALVEHYIDVYGEMLRSFLTRHKESINSHGLTAAQVGFNNLQNHKTSFGLDVLKPDTDRNLTPEGLKTIIENYGFNSGELLENNLLPISRYGNTNFIPPSIDGSFEAIGSRVASSAISLESDGTIVMLCERFDGRVEGLYFTVMNLTGPNRGFGTYTGYKYKHPFLEANNFEPTQIFQGSGKHCMLLSRISEVGSNNICYIGLSNGTLDPTKHVYSKVNLAPLMEALVTQTASTVADAAEFINIAFMGEWIYIFVSHAFREKGVSEPEKVGAMYRHIWRVPTARIGIDEFVPVSRVSVSFMDMDGVQWTNTNQWRWATPDYTIEANGFVSVRKLINTYLQPPQIGSGLRYNSSTFCLPHPTKPGIYLLKFVVGEYMNYVYQSLSRNTNMGHEINYEFNPATGVMTFLDKTPKQVVDFHNWSYLNNGVTNYFSRVPGTIGAEILETGELIICSSGARGTPKTFLAANVRNVNNNADMIRTIWLNTAQYIFNDYERYTVPTPNGINPSSPGYVKQGEYFTALSRDPSLNETHLFFKQITGPFALRPEINNLNLSPIHSRALTSNVRRVNANGGIGMAQVTCPSSELSRYGFEVGDSEFCVGFQAFYVGANEGYVPKTNNLMDVLLLSEHRRVLRPDGMIDIETVSDILYPEAIVNRIKNEVEFPAIKDQSGNAPIFISDLNGRLTQAYGWLPVVAVVYYAETGSVDLRSTTIILEPVYSVSGNRRTVTGFTVLEKFHDIYLGYGLGSNPWYGYNLQTKNSGGQSQGKLRAYYYMGLNNQLNVTIDTGMIVSAVGNTHTPNKRLYYANKTTKRITSHSHGFTGSATPALVSIPDIPLTNLVSQLITGSCAAISGRVNPQSPWFLLFSTYPESGWIIYFNTEQTVIFNGKEYTLPTGMVDLRDLGNNPSNKTFYIYATYANGMVLYDITEDKILETPFYIWIGTAVTGLNQIETIERFNVFTLNGHRISETKRGNSIPASSGDINQQGQLPWIKRSELLP